MRAIRHVVPVVLVGAYGAFYAHGWYYVWRVHQTDPGDGLEYMVVFVATLPWSALLPPPVLAFLPRVALPVFLTAFACANATLLWWGSRRLLAAPAPSGQSVLGRFTKRRSPGE